MLHHLGTICEKLGCGSIVAYRLIWEVDEYKVLHCILPEQELKTVLWKRSSLEVNHIESNGSRTAKSNPDLSCIHRLDPNSNHLRQLECRRSSLNADNKEEDLFFLLHSDLVIQRNTNGKYHLLRKNV